MALTSQISRAARVEKPPVGTQAIDREPSSRRIDDDDRRSLAVGLCDVAIRHTCNANEPEQGDPCTNRLHARDAKAAREALILAGLAPDPYPSVERPPDISCAVPAESKHARERRLRDEREAKLPRPDWAWQDRAQCRGEDEGLFIPPDNEHKRARDAREKRATRVCGFCPVRLQCLDGAMERREVGIWGGLNDEQRASERRRRTRQSRAA